MTSAADAAAAPTDFDLGNGQSVVLHPLSIRDIGRWERYMKQSVIDAARTSVRQGLLEGSDEKGRLADPLVEVEMRIIMSEAHRTAAMLSFGSDAAMGFLGSFDGMLYFIYLSVAHNEGWTGGLDDAAMIVPGFEIMGDMVEQIMEVSGLVDREAKAKAEREAAKNEPGPAAPPPATTSPTSNGGSPPGGPSPA